jgi:hypothetical protein
MNFYSKLCIEYADPSNLLDSITVPFRLQHNSVVQKWINKLVAAQRQYQIDDPARFYGFGSPQDQRNDAISKINKCIDVINNHDRIIDRKLEFVEDSDTLNYLHHVFEVYHGFLDQQNHPYYIAAPSNVRNALADLNILVHRCESIARGSKVRHVVTYYGLPKTDQLAWQDYKHFTDMYTAGTVYLNYVEIGKTLEDLAIDNDSYIADEAFRPFRHYSADFTVQYFNSDCNYVFDKRDLIKKYYLQNSKFFLDRGLYDQHPYLKPGKIPLADIEADVHDVLKLIETRQFVKSVKLI